MKIFDLPTVPANDWDEHDVYAITSTIYPWTNGRFIVELKSKFDEPERSRMGIPQYQYYTVDQELIPVLTRRNQIPGNETFQSILADSNNENFYLNIPGKTLVTYPDLKHCDDSIKDKVLPIGGANFFRSENKAIIAGSTYVYSYSRLKLVQLFVKDLNIEMNEVAIFEFNGTSYSFNKMKLAGNGMVLNVAISFDELTACALIKRKKENWKVVLWDLE